MNDRDELLGLMKSARPTKVSIAEGRRLLEAMRAEEQSTSPHEPRPRYVEWIVWARNNAEALINLVDDTALNLECREDDYQHLADNYRQLRESINRIYGTLEAASHYALQVEVRSAYAEIAQSLLCALDGPLRRVYDGLPPPPLPAGLNPGLGDWRIAAIDRGGEPIVLHANPVRFEEVRVDGRVKEWIITLTPIREETSGA